jgi:hypothetical protein
MAKIYRLSNSKRTPSQIQPEQLTDAQAPKRSYSHANSAIGHECRIDDVGLAC